MSAEQTRAEQVAEVLADLNVSGWRQESAHGCDGTEEVCAQTCPIPVQVEVSPEEIAAAIDNAVREAQAAAWDEGYALDWTGGMKHANPYRKGAAS